MNREDFYDGPDGGGMNDSNNSNFMKMFSMPPGFVQEQKKMMEQSIRMIAVDRTIKFVGTPSTDVKFLLETADKINEYIKNGIK